MRIFVALLLSIHPFSNAEFMILKHSVIMCWALAMLVFIPACSIAQKKANSQNGTPSHIASLIKSAKKNTCKGKKPTTGIAGTVVEETGNRMPGPNAAASKPNFVSKVIAIYPAVTTDEVVPVPDEVVFYQAVKKKKVVATVLSDANGCFQIALKPGRYSVFIVENNKLYANGFDGDGTINPITVGPDELSTIQLLINYKAVY